MSCELVLSEHLRTNAAVAALVNGRIYPVALPPKVGYPAIITALAMQEPNRTVSGAESTRLVRGTALAVVVAKAPDQLKSLCAAVISAANRKIGSAAGFAVTTCHYSRSEADQFDVELDVYSRGVYFSVSYVEAQP